MRGVSRLRDGNPDGPTWVLAVTLYAVPDGTRMATEPTPEWAAISCGGAVNPALIMPVPVFSATRCADIPLARICPTPVRAEIVPDRLLSRIGPTSRSTIAARSRGTVRSKETPQLRDQAGQV